MLSSPSSAAAFAGADADIDDDIDEDKGSKLINNWDDCLCNHFFFQFQDESLSCRRLLKGQKVRKLKDEEVRKSDGQNVGKAEEKEAEEMEEEKEEDKEKDEMKKEEKEEEDSDRENEANLTNSVDARHETTTKALKLILDNNKQQQEKLCLLNNGQRSDTKTKKAPEDKESGRNEAETSNATYPAEYSADDIMPTSSSRFEDESEVWQRWVDSTHLMMWRHKRFFFSLEESAGVSTNILKQIMSCPFLPINFSTSTEVKRPAQVEVRQSAPVELGSPAPVEPGHPSRIRSSKDRSSVYQSISSQRGPLSTLSTAQMN